MTHTLGDDLSDTITIPHSQVRAALGVNHGNLSNVTGISMASPAAKHGGTVAVSVTKGNGDMLPLTDRKFVLHPSGAMFACTHAVVPGEANVTELATFKPLPNDAFTPVGEEDPASKTRNLMNAVHYPHAEAPPDDASMYQHVTWVEHDGVKKGAVPLGGPDPGGLSVVLSRAMTAKGATPVRVVGPGTTQVTMKHLTTGEEVPHMVATEESFKKITNEITKNTAIVGPLANGLTIKATGTPGHSKPGDKIPITLTIHREPTGDANTVTLTKDLIPGQSPVMLGCGPTAAGSRDMDVITAAMFGAKATGGIAIEAPQAIAASDGEAAAEDPNSQ